MSRIPDHPRLHELLADRATVGLTPAEQAELRVLFAQLGVEDDATYDLAAAEAAVAMTPPGQRAALSPESRRRLEAAASAWIRDSVESAPRAPDVVGRLRPEPASPAAPARRTASAWSAFPWLLAAASLALALIAWKPWAARSTFQPRPPTLTLAQLREQVLAAPDAITLSWGDFKLQDQAPEIPGVQGDVVWSDAQQAGCLRFSNLRPNDPTKEQYQLWIIDKRGLSQRVSGGVFNCCLGEKECLIKIEPGLLVQGAAAFAVTIEPPGGNAVSDMTRRVCIAAKK